VRKGLKAAALAAASHSLFNYIQSLTAVRKGLKAAALAALSRCVTGYAGRVACLGKHTYIHLRIRDIW
jgi:hypothetical protein